MVKIAELGSTDVFLIVADKNGFLARKTLEVYFPAAVGLMYLNDSKEKNLVP